MLLPYRTNAPVYHWPIGTVLVIALCVSLSFLAGGGGLPAPPGGAWALEHGRGLHPVEWLTWSFVHSTLWQLIPNAGFLWVVGLVVEGKLGLRRYLAIVLGLGIAQGALVQALSLAVDIPGASLGSTATLLGLLAMALVWAPENDVEALYLLGFHAGTLSIRIRFLLPLFLGWQLLGSLRGLFGAISPLGAALQLTGGAMGMALGLVLLKRGAVDCEGWDIFSVRFGRPRAIRLHRPAPPPGEPREERGARVAEDQATALELLRTYVREGRPDLAAEVHAAEVKANGPWPLDSSTLTSIVELFVGRDDLAEARPFLEELIARFPHGPASFRLLLAEALLREGLEPARALEVLAPLGDGAYLSAPEQRVHRGLVRTARALLAAAGGEEACAAP